MGLNRPSNTDNDNNSSLIKFFEISKDTFLVVDRNLKITYVNPQTKDFSNVEREEMIGKTLWDMFPLSKEPLNYEKYHKALNTGIPQHWERPSKFTNKWAEISVYPLENGGLIIIGRDITEKKQMEFELKESSRLKLIEKEKEYLEILDSCSLGTIVIDFNKRGCYISKEWKRRLGFENITSRETFSRLWEILHPEDMDLCIMCDINKKNPFGERELKHVAEYRVKTTDSGYVWVLEQAKIIYDEEGKPIKAYGTHIDITNRKLSEDALRKSERKAQRLVRGLHKENIYKNSFISTLSHELRNPLAAISMGLSLIEHVPPGSEQDKYAREIIKRQTAQLKRLADDLLDVTRAKTNKTKLIKENVEINEIVKKTSDEFRVQFNMKGIILKGKYYADSIYLNADPARIKQVIENLLFNALKFTEKNGVVEFSVSEDNNTNDVVISIIDTGIGIAPELLPNLFKPFVQADNSLARSAGGLGLGLSIVREIVDLHGGSIIARSEGLGKGSEFIIRLPL